MVQQNYRNYSGAFREDAGKSLHGDYETKLELILTVQAHLTEIVSEPDTRSSKEAIAYLKAVHSLVRYLEISGGNMQEGSFR